MTAAALETVTFDQCSGQRVDQHKVQPQDELPKGSAAMRLENVTETAVNFSANQNIHLVVSNISSSIELSNAVAFFNCPWPEKNHRKLGYKITIAAAKQRSLKWIAVLISKDAR